MVIEDIEKKFIEINKERHHLINLYDKGQIVQEEFEGRMLILNYERDDLKEEYKILKKEIDNKKTKLYEREYKKFEEAYNSMDGRRRRKRK